ncbi:MAG TPA: hypothetical protein PK440_20490, partial [Candidatus Accumulibacter phosphatis]|nr:hypothetical protein [Candidatus Accumulibacter phosphatis]
ARFSMSSSVVPGCAAMKYASDARLPAVAAPRGMRRENLFLRRAVNADAPSVRLGRPGSSLRSRRLFSGRWRWLPGGSRRAGHDVEPGASSAEQNAR